MKGRGLHPRVRIAGPVAAVAMGAAALALAATPALSGSDSVSARWNSQMVTGPECLSPVGFCTRGVMKGQLKGTFQFTASSLNATADTPTTGVLHYAGDMVITTAEGTPSCKDSGAVSNRQDRSAVGICVVIAGTRRFAGASGQLRSVGTWPWTDPDGVRTIDGQGVTEGALEVR